AGQERKLGATSRSCLGAGTNSPFAIPRALPALEPLPSARIGQAERGRRPPPQLVEGARRDQRRERAQLRFRQATPAGMASGVIRRCLSLAKSGSIETSL